MNDKQFRFDLGAQVQIKVSGETGEVVGRAQYTTAENAYFVRYRAADGQAREQWWAESALASGLVDVA